MILFTRRDASSESGLLGASWRCSAAAGDYDGALPLCGRRDYFPHSGLFILHLGGVVLMSSCQCSVPVAAVAGELHRRLRRAE